MNADDMTPEEVKRFLAVEVMDFEIDPDPNRKEWCHTPEGDYDWNPLTDANDRDDLVVTLQAKRWMIISKMFPTGKVAVTVCRITEPDVTQIWSDADDPGTAVCRAAVKAVMESKK